MSDIFTLDENNNAAVRTISVKSGAVETNKADIFTTDENGNAAVRVVGGAGSVNLDEVIIKSSTIPTANADVLGQMYCFDGETNANYTHGYVYECVEGQPSYADTVTFTPASISGTVVTATSNALANLCAEYITGDITSIVAGTMTYDESGDLWVFVGKDSEDTTVGTFQLYTQDYEDAGFTFTGTPQDGDVVAFTCTITESSSYVWERINLQPEAKLGRYLSSWNCATGLAGTNPPVSPYEYTRGDYFIVSAVATGGANNYKPNGSSYVTGQASTTVETNTVAINDTYFYDGTNWTLLKTGSAVTSVNGQTGDVSLKTINGNTLTGSGNVQISGFLPFPAGWTTNSTTKALCDDIAADTTTVKGSAFLGEVTCSDLPASIANSEINVYINDGTTAANKVIILELTSGNTAPYRWVYVYWNGGSDVSGWQGLGGDKLPSQTGNAGKFLTTDGTDASWGDALTNRGTKSSSVLIKPASSSDYSVTSSVVIGGRINANNSVCFGSNSAVSGQYSVAVGTGANSSSTYGIGIGFYAGAYAPHAIQIGNYYTNGADTYNNDANTMKVANANGNYEIMSADGTIPADRLVKSINKYSIMPTAASTNEGWIVQYTGTTDANYTHGYIYECVSDGGNPATYSWVQTNVQPAGSSLPSQTGNSGKFLTTDGTDASWSDKPLVNTATGSWSITIKGAATTQSSCLNIGDFSNAFGAEATSLGVSSQAGGGCVSVGAAAESDINGVAIGKSAKAKRFSGNNNNWAIAIGNTAVASAHQAIQIGKGTNSDANTMKVSNENGNYEMMSANGTIPTDRFTTTPVADGVYTPTVTISSGVATRSWSSVAGTLATLPGYDATKTQTLKNVSGILTWVDD